MKKVRNIIQEKIKKEKDYHFALYKYYKALYKDLNRKGGDK